MSFTADRLLLFGATGDLSQRMLLPSLCALDADGLVDPNLRIVCTARSAHDTPEFRNFARAALEKFLPAERRGGVATFLNRLHYQTLDATDQAGYEKLAKMVGTPENGLAIFLSTAPSLFEPTIAGLQGAGLTDGNVRIGLEKPLGIDLASSREINDAVAAAFAEDRIFRIDHYLGKETVQNLLALRFGNLMFEPLWNATGIDHVQITVGETVGLEGRVSYYDGVGALRDMVQNHMLQILSIIAMEPPARMDPTAVRDEKVKALRSLRPMTAETVKTHSVRGQYTPGAVGGQIVTGYADELGKPSTTETFVAVKAYIDNWRWQGVPFYLRTGKRMPERQSEIMIQFKPVRHSIFGRDGHGSGLESNTMVIRLQPEEYIRLTIMSKRPGLERQVHLDEVTLDVSLTAAFAGQRRRIAYERLILDLLAGDPTLFVRRDEVEAQWTWIDSIIDGWKEANMKPAPYSSGNWGPSSAIALIERDGASWHD